MSDVPSAAPDDREDSLQLQERTFERGGSATTLENSLGKSERARRETEIPGNAIREQI